jgi:hypothetical protein
MCGFSLGVERNKEDTSDDRIDVMHATLSSSNQSSVTINFFLTIDATESILVSVGEVSSSFVTSVAAERFCYRK